jgi:hypothetical protein
MVVKNGSQHGKQATVTEPNWDGTAGRLKVAMDGCGTVKSYLPFELRKIQPHKWKKVHQILSVLRSC